MINDVTDTLLKAFYDDEEINGKTFPLLDDDHLVMMINDVFNAAYQTATERLLWFLSYMVNYPNVQSRAQTELDKSLVVITNLVWQIKETCHIWNPQLLKCFA